MHFGGNNKLYINVNVNNVTAMPVFDYTGTAFTIIPNNII